MRTASKAAAKAGVVLTTGTTDEFFARSRERARKLDRGERIPAGIRVTFEDPADLLQVLSTERIRLLHAVGARPIPVSQLARELKRDRQAVMRDVRLLESFGLLKTQEAPNPGHGRQRIVAPLAARYQLVANI
jgi:predicted transcriptional regulator